MQLTPQALQAFQAHVLAEYPREACGVIVGEDYHAVHNASATPEKDALIRAVDLLRIEAEIGPVRAILHSHPYKLSTPMLHSPEWPSHVDMQQWIASGLPWGIVATDGSGTTPVLWLDDNERPPLLNRDFQHGVADCYALVRDYFHFERGIELPNFPRGWDWWHSGEDHYIKNFQSAGFRVIQKDEAVPGDCVMYKIKSSVVNHAAVITGPDTILHHLIRRKSCYDSKSKWDGLAEHYVRYKQ